MPIRFALIGCGGMADTHISRFQPLLNRMRFVAAVDVDRPRAQAVADSFPGAAVATDFRQILPQVDAVLLSLPHHLHHPIGMACLQAGKHVLMEKPLANTEPQCLDLITAAHRADRVLMVAYCMRFHPMILKLKQLLDNQTYGQVFQLSIWTEQYTRYQPGHWALSAEKLGGGQFFSHGCHYIDLLLYFLGRPLRGTHLGTNYGTPWMEKEGTSNVTLEFESGPLGYHFGTWGAQGTRLGYAIHAHCTEAMLEADITHGQLNVHRRTQPQAAPNAPLEPPHLETLMQTEPGCKFTNEELAHFLDCIESHRTPITDGPTSLQGLRIIWRLYAAEQSNTIADLRGLGHDQADPLGRLISKQLSDRRDSHPTTKQTGKVR